MHAMILNCVWETKSLHTIFRYILTFMSNDMRYGKTLAHCFYKVSSEIYGGVTPILDDIQTESPMVHLIVGSIFVHNTVLQYKNKLKHILDESVLRFYDKFLGIIVN